MSLKAPPLSRMRLNLILNRISFSACHKTVKTLYLKERHSICKYSTATVKQFTNDEISTRKYASPGKILIQTKDTLHIDDIFSIINVSLEKTGRIFSKNVYNIFDLIQANQVNNLNSLHGLYLIRSCGYMLDEMPAKRIEFANKVWNKLSELGLPFSVRHYNSIMKIHLENGSSFNPAEMLASMEDQNILPNKASYTLFIKQYCKEGNLDGASEILEFMKAKQIPVDADVFSALIEGHLLNKDFEGAKNILNAMRSSGIGMTDETTALFVCADALNNKENELQRFFESVQVSTLSNKSLFKIIEALALSGNEKYINKSLLYLTPPPRSNIHEFVNVSIDLIHKDLIDLGYRILKCVPGNEKDELNMYCTVIFLQQLLKSEKPVSKIVEICTDVINKKNDNIIVNIAKAAVDYGKIDYAIEVFKEMLQQGYPLRRSHFISLFNHMKINEGEIEYSNDDIWKILKGMQNLGIPCTYSTYNINVYPLIQEMHDPVEIISKIKETGQFEDTACTSLLSYYCKRGEFDLAVKLIESFPVKIYQSFDFQNLFNSQSSGSLSALKVLKYALENVEDGIEDPSVVRTKCLMDLILKHNGLFKQLLKNQDLLGEFSFDSKVISLCQEELKKFKPQLVGDLLKLKTKNAPLYKPMTKEEEDKCIDFLKSKDLSCQMFLTERLFYHIREKNLGRINELSTLYRKQFMYTPILLSQLIQLYCSVGDIQKCKELVAELENNHSTFQLEFSKTMIYAGMLIKYGEHDEALRVLKKHVHIISEPKSKDHLLRNLRNFLTCICESQNVELLNECLNILAPLSKFLPAKEALVDPRVNIHLYRNDLASAVEEYRATLMQYHVPIRLNSILKKCILQNDISLLERVVDVTCCYSNRTVALVELAIAFIETGRSDRAGKTLEELGAKTNFSVLLDICSKIKERLSEFEEFVFLALEHLPLSPVQNKMLLMQLFDAYSNKNDHQKALKVFNRLSKKMLEIPFEIQDSVTKLLSKNKVPLTAMSVYSPEEAEEEIDPVKSKNIEAFLQQLESGNITLVLNELEDMKAGYIHSLSSESLTKLFDLCVRNGKLEELSRNTPAMTSIIDNYSEIIRPCLVKYADAGEVDHFKYIASIMPDYTLKSIGYNSHLAKAFISSNRHSELLDELEKYSTGKKFLFSTLAYEELLKFPEYEDRLLNLAVKFYESKYDIPIATLWMHYFLQENFEKANSIYSNFSFALDKIDGRILKHLRISENVNMAQQYLDIIINAKAKDRVKVRAFGTVLDVLVLKGEYDTASKVVEQCPVHLQPQLFQYYRSTLVTLTSALERENKPIKFNLPVVEAEGSSKFV